MTEKKDMATAVAYAVDSARQPSTVLYSDPVQPEAKGTERRILQRVQALVMMDVYMKKKV